MQSLHAFVPLCIHRHPGATAYWPSRHPACTGKPLSCRPCSIIRLRRPMMQQPATVLVTGASGYIAGWIVKLLLEQGHTVHGTVRDPDNHKSVAHLHALADAAPGTLRLFKADLLDMGS